MMAFWATSTLPFYMYREGGLYLYKRDFDVYACLTFLAGFIPKTVSYSGRAPGMGSFQSFGASFGVCVRVRLEVGVAASMLT
jgi:hypothetical protein